MDTKQLCDTCGAYLPADPFTPCACVSRQSPEFYVGEGAVARRGDFVVSAVGEMRIKVSYTNTKGLVVEDTIRYASDLYKLAIDTDQELNDFCDRNEVINNPWFEVYSTFEGGEFSEPIFELDEAVALMIEWHDKETERELCVIV
jgi:hypothetical protein